jgi:hypothetical protein
MAVDDAKRLGYGGSAEIDGIQVLMTSGNFDTAKTVSYLEPYDVVPTLGASRSRVKHADGTEAYTVNVSFDVTTQFLAILTTGKLFSRGYSFNIGIDDGTDAQEMTGCILQSLSLSGASNGIITATLSAIGASAPVTSVGVDNDYIRDTDIPLGYWYSGNTDVRDWTLSMNQAVSPVYGNEDVVAPRYIKYGLIDFSLAVTTFEAVIAHDAISIATSTFTITGDTASEGFAFAGTTDLGNYSHLFESSAVLGFGSGGSDGIIIT